MAGPILAGWLLHLDLFGSQWRSIFLINVPIGVVAWSLGWWFLPHRTGEDANARLDLGGAGLHWTPLHTSLTLIPWALGSAVAVGLAGAVLTRKLGRATMQLGLGIAVIGLLARWWTIVRWGDSLTSWTLAPSLLLIGFGTGLVFVPIFDFILGDATTEEVGTGSGMLNAVQQFSGAIGVAALGTVFFARVNHGGTAASDNAAELVIGLAAGLYLITFALVWLLPKHAQAPAAEPRP